MNPLAWGYDRLVRCVVGDSKFIAKRTCRIDHTSSLDIDRFVPVRFRGIVEIDQAYSDHFTRRVFQESVSSKVIADDGTVLGGGLDDIQ